MYGVSNTFKTKIKDQTTPKSCLILFDDLFFSTTDITDGGAEFDQYFNTSDDLTYGDCPSDTLSFAVVSDGTLAGYKFGKCRTYLGVQIASSTYAFGDINAHIEVYGNTYTASNSGLYRNDVQISQAVYHSLIANDTTVWAIGTNYSAKVDDQTGTITAYSPNPFMVWKLGNHPMSATFLAGLDEGYVWDGEYVYTYEYCPMGVYNVEKPRTTLGDVVEIQDAYDNMSLFDRDASEFLESLTYPCTLSQIYTGLCNYVGAQYATSGFPYSTVSYDVSPFSDTQCTCRDILWWIAERAMKVAKFDRNGVLELKGISTTVRETLTASDIGQDGYSVAEFATPAVTGVLLRSKNGASIRYGSLDNPYVISANPFFNSVYVSDQQVYLSIPTYVPMELTVLEADPSIDVGDFVSVKPMVEAVQALTNVYTEIYGSMVAFQSENDNALADDYILAQPEAWAMASPTYSIPLMNRKIKFIGSVFRAEYEATGNEKREADISDTEYNADVATNMSKEYTDRLDSELNQRGVFNRLTNNGQDQGIYLAGGKIYINAEYIATGVLASPNGAFSLDMQTGTVNMASANITGGSININSDSATYDVISLNYITGGLDYHLRVSPSEIKLTDNNKTSQLTASSLGFASLVGGTTRNRVYISQNRVYLRGDGDNDNYLFDYAAAAGLMTIYASASNRKRVEIDPTMGIKFYDENGNVTKYYSAT